MPGPVGRPTNRMPRSTGAILRAPTCRLLRQGDAGPPVVVFIVPHLSLVGFTRQSPFGSMFCTWAPMADEELSAMGLVPVICPVRVVALGGA